MAVNPRHTEILTSARNPLLRDVRRALDRGELTSEGFCVAETFHLLEEAIRSDVQVKAVLAATSVRSAVERHVRGLRNFPVTVVRDDIFHEISSTESSQGVITLAKPPAWQLDQLFRGRTLLVVLDGIQDPGNAGTILRTAEAFGATGVLFIKGSVSPYNPKVLRASAGSVFRLPLVAAMDPLLAQAALEQHRLDIYAASSSAKASLTETNLTRRIAIIMGSEAHGVSERMRGIARELRIPTSGVESLNAAMAAGILLYEASRQRRLKK